MTETVDLVQAVVEFVGAPTRESVRQICPLAGGRNNRVFSVELDNERYLLKWYFHDPNHDHDRFLAEYEFSTFLWQQGIRNIPQPLAADPQRRLALFSFVSGRRLAAGEISAHRVREAATFLKDINRYRGKPEAAALPPAAEACFTLNEHCQLIARRHRQLESMSSSNNVDCEAREFIVSELAAVWQDISKAFRMRAKELQFPLDAPLSPSDRCLSPSDFGFHNALLVGDGHLVFFDFEYAGWDDPAKLVADFFCQVELPVPETFLATFTNHLIATLNLPDWHRERIELILPLYRIKWCCIVLNEFLISSSQRRRFAGERELPVDAKRRQLQLAKKLVSALK